MIQRFPRVVRSTRGPISTDNHHVMWPKPQKSPPDAKAIFLRWLAAASAGDSITANHALVELKALAVSPRTKTDVK